jgi:single-strand selective monofunctional uracil DNA glycosylase
VAKQPALVTAASRLKRAVAHYPGLAPAGKAAYILNPLDYAWAIHKGYLERYGPRAPGQVEAVLVGMNPGPWGMAQTGVPFGTPGLVREFLGLQGAVKQPTSTHPKRPIVGLDSPREEVSGQRLWGGIRDCFGTADAFFARFFVLNYCPLVFQSETGANVTPDKLSKDFLAPCMEACEDHMRRVLKAIAPGRIIGVGKWAEKQMARVVDEAGLDIPVASVLHPSPASPIANRGWLPAAREQLEALGHPWPAPGGR